MREIGIQFSAPMVQAILSGAKTVTRRTVKGEIPAEAVDAVFAQRCVNRPAAWAWRDSWLATVGKPFRCPYGVPGDRLWVKHAPHLFPIYFKPIAGWEGTYAAGTDGAIYRMDRDAPDRLDASPNSKGYPTVSLSRGEWHTHSVHRLVCEAFYGPPPFVDAQVRHLDGDRCNSSPANLDWGSQSDNWQDRKGHGGGMGEQHHAAKLAQDAIAEIRTSDLPQRQLARKFGVSQATISDARLGKTWADHPVGRRNLPAFSLWKAGDHMPHWASRIVLEVTEVRVERLQAMSVRDAIAEGIPQGGPENPDGIELRNFRDLWASLNGADSWATNPFVFAISFRRINP